ncbi:MAG TPA: hypothetical protein H9982_03230 [Candidatus Barnesiella excrementipullorum]|uniref:Lipoprotein n=1 Tax=Candidatus Barnesiella excrementipullorum TaxID=2838479 RepID=A0A9D1VRT2_9BACT|nr:hypothetical protein [Candidatus Barnesiella excrementipullorum]
MKKLVLFFAVACAVSLAACTNKASEATEVTEDTVAVETVVEEVACACDSCACDSCTGNCGAEVAATDSAVVAE